MMTDHAIRNFPTDRIEEINGDKDTEQPCNAILRIKQYRPNYVRTYVRTELYIILAER